MGLREPTVPHVLVMLYSVSAAARFILFCVLATAPLLTVSALAARVPRNPASFVIRPALITLVRAARVTILGPVAHALVARFLVLLLIILAVFMAVFLAEIFIYRRRY